MNLSRRLLCLLVVWLVACAPDSTADKPVAPSGHKTLSQRMEQKNGYKQDAKGNWVPQSDQRSSFESKGKSPYFQGEYQKKTYQTDTYSKKSWWGSKDYGRQKYAGNTDGGRFQKSSDFTRQGARETGTNADLPPSYQTSDYATHAARETTHSGIQKKSDTQTDIRRRVYQAPEIIDWKEQRTLSLEQSKGLLGH